MQRQRGIVGSLPETLDFDHGPAAGNSIMDQPICWNSMRSPTENRLADFMLSPIPPNNSYINSVDEERRNLNGWSLGQSSSSSAQNEVSHEEQKAENGWSASVSRYAGGGPRLEERRYEPINVVSLDNVTTSPFAEGSNSHIIPQNLDLNVADNCQVMDGSNMYKSSGSENDQTLSASGSNAFQHPSGSGGEYLMEDNDGRPGGSVDGRRHSCKRKAVEGNIGQSSVSGSSSFFHRSENSGWSGVPARDTAGGSLTISSPSERGIPRHGASVRRIGSENIPDSVSSARGESSQRNFRVRINPFSQESVPPSFFSAGSTRRSGAPSSHQSSRLLPVDHSLDFRSSQGIDGTTSQNHPVVIPVPAGPQNVQPFGWNESSGSRTGNSSGSITLGDREEARSMGRNRWQGPVLIPATVTESRAPVTNPGRTVTGGNVSLPGNGASTSRTGSSLGTHSLSASSWASHPNPPPRNSRRLAEYVRRSLFSSIGTESGVQSSTHSPLHAGPPATTEETLLPSGSNNQGHHRYSRLASLMERQGDGVFGIPYPLRTLGAVGEGRSRLVVSEIRNVLDLMRRGESLRFEDVMILDQSVLFGMADIHDRHRDMRMDVDNMSYEELLALEERIGNVSTGLSEETIGSRLKQRKYSTSAGAEVKAEPCCICQEEYNDGEDLGTLDCGHDFHTDCIKQWLKLKNWCPICKTTGLAT